MRKTKNNNDYIKVNTDLIKRFRELVDSSFENEDDCLSTLLIIYKLKKVEENSYIRLKEYVELKTYLNYIESLFNSIYDKNNKEIINIEKMKDTKEIKDSKTIKVNKNIFKIFKELVKSSFKNEDDCLRNLIFTYQLQQKNNSIKIEKEIIKLQKYLYYIKYLFINTIEEYNYEKELIIEDLKNEIKELNKSLKINKKKYSTLLEQKSEVEDQFVIKEKKYKEAIDYLKTEIILQGGDLVEFDFDRK